MKRVPRRIFTEEFKKEVIRLFKQQDLTLAEVSRNLDIAPKSLKHGWLCMTQVRLNQVLALLNLRQTSYVFVS